jgi:hypothetical protein
MVMSIPGMRLATEFMMPMRHARSELLYAQRA